MSPNWRRRTPAVHHQKVELLAAVAKGYGAAGLLGGAVIPLALGVERLAAAEHFGEARQQFDGHNFLSVDGDARIHLDGIALVQSHHPLAACIAAAVNHKAAVGN